MVPQNQPHPYTPEESEEEKEGEEEEGEEEEMYDGVWLHLEGGASDGEKGKGSLNGKAMNMRKSGRMVSQEQQLLPSSATCGSHEQQSGSALLVGTEGDGNGRDDLRPKNGRQQQRKEEMKERPASTNLPPFPGKDPLHIAPDNNIAAVVVSASKSRSNPSPFSPSSPAPFSS